MGRPLSPIQQFFASMVRPPDRPGERLIGTKLAGALLQEVDLTHSHLRGVNLVNAEIWGGVSGLVVNGVEIEPLIEAELERRYPGRATLFAGDPDGVRAAWATIEGLWAATMARVRALPEALLHERPIPEEWSVLESLRHLVFVDGIFIRQVHDRDRALYRASVVHPDTHDLFEGIVDLDADPDLDDVAAARDEAFAVVREIVAGVDAGELDRVARVAPHDPAGFDMPVRVCFWRLVNEEWEHHLYVVRDLEALERSVQ